MRIHQRVCVESPQPDCDRGAEALTAGRKGEEPEAPPRHSRFNNHCFDNFPQDKAARIGFHFCMDRSDPQCDRPALESLRRQRLRRLMTELVPANRFHSERLRRAGVDAATIREPADVARLPFLTKAELLDDQKRRPPYGTNLTFEPSLYTRLHQTSGTSDAPLRRPDTPADWSDLLDCWTTIFQAAEITSADKLFFPFSFGPFLGFWTAFEAAQRIGCLVMAAGGMSSPARLRFLIDNAATVVLCTPTYALRLAEVAAEEGIDLAGSGSGSKVRALVVAGEPGGSIPAVRERIEAAWGARVFDHIGMTETGPTGFECAQSRGTGVHILEADFIAEVIEPTTGRPAAAGELGELVLTNLGRIGGPLLRYRTGDLVKWSDAPCPCGRCFGRLEGGILGRADDMVIVRGNNVYPGALESVLKRFADVAEYRVEIFRDGALAEMRVDLEPAVAAAPDLADRVARALQSALNLRIDVATVPPGTLPRFEMKAKRFVRRGN